MEFHKKQRFSIRKFKVGTFSVLIGAILVGVPTVTPLLPTPMQNSVVYAAGEDFNHAMDGALQPVNFDPKTHGQRVQMSYVKGDDGYLYWTVVFNNNLSESGSGYYSFTVPNGVGTPENWSIDVTTHSAGRWHYDDWQPHRTGDAARGGYFRDYGPSSEEVGYWAKPKQE